MKKISIVLPCRNEEIYIGKIINEITLQQGIDRDFHYELLVIDGMSSDSTGKIIQNLAKNNSRIKLIRNVKKTTPYGLNLGVKYATGEYICVLNAHAEIANNYLLSALKVIEKTSADNVGGPWKAKGKSYIGKAIAFAFQSPFSAGGAKSHNINYEGWVDSVWGGFYKKEVFENIGHYDNELVRNQDDELNLRLIRSGGKIWQSKKIKLHYFSRESLWNLIKQYYQYGYWRVLVIKKHKKPASPRQIIPGVFILLLLVLIITSFFSSVAKILLSITLISYSLFILVASIDCAIRHSWLYLPIFPLVFFCYHFAYGLGTLNGIYEFLILNRRSKWVSNITR